MTDNPLAQSGDLGMSALAPLLCRVSDAGMNDGAMCAVAGVRKPPKNEPAGDARGKSPHSAMGIWLKRKVGATDRNTLEDEQ